MLMQPHPKALVPRKRDEDIHCSKPFSIRKVQSKPEVERPLSPFKATGNVRAEQINLTPLQYANAIAFAVSQRSTRMEINAAALLGNTNQRVCDFVKSFLSL